MKTIRDLAVELCRREGKKKQVNVAQMSEILARLADTIAETPAPITILAGAAVKKMERKARRK